jgi:NAD(P)-dependent dehydrogenase (short-subunit alcohol dehydrogenase family)
MVAKRANLLRVQAEAVRWAERGARVNAISPGIIVTALAAHELNSDIGDIYRAMVEASPSKRMAPPEEIAVAASFLLGPDAGFITGSDLLIDGGVIAAMREASCRRRAERNGEPFANPHPMYRARASAT